MAKVKLKEVIGGNFILALNKLSEQPVTATAAHALAKIHKRAVEEATEYEEARQKALKKYAVLKKDGEVDSDKDGQIKFKNDDDKASAVKEIEELLEQEIDLPQLKLSSIGDLKVDVGVIATLDKVISED